MNTPLSNINFPDRKSLKKKLEEKPTAPDYFNSIREKAKELDLDSIDFSKESTFRPRTKIVEKQEEMVWIRIFTEQEFPISQGDTIIIEDLLYDDTMEVKFMFWGKMTPPRKESDELVEWVPQDDKNCLVIGVDIKRVNYKSEDIPYLRTLFSLSIWWRPTIVKKSDLIFRHKKTKKIIEYKSIDL